jgi:hypothetical protein
MEVLAATCEHIKLILLCNVIYLISMLTEYCEYKPHTSYMDAC